MPLTIPNLDDRDYKAILREALARIPVHNPAWTNFNDSDPGVTLIQLFAFMTESLLYRANQIPERSRLKFLQLLGIPLQAAAAARGFITIHNERGPLEVQPLAADLDVRAGAVQFRTTQGLSVLPVEARVFFKSSLPPAVTDEEKATEALYKLLYTDLLEESTPAFYVTTPLPAPDAALPVVNLADTVDGCLWLALLTRSDKESPAAVRAKIANQPLTLGVLPKLSAAGLVVPAGQETLGEGEAQIVWEIANPVTNTPSYMPLSPRADVNVLRSPGLVELKLPANPSTWAMLEPGEEGTGDFPPLLADASLSKRVITWLRLRVGGSGGRSVKAEISWVGINATMVEQRATVIGEVIGTGTGEPDQCFRIASTPVIPASLTLTVNGERWDQVDDLLAAAPEVPVEDSRLPLYQSERQIAPGRTPRTKVYRLDAEAGQVCFGDGAHGLRPPAGAVIAVSYAFGGGIQGNVAAGALNRSPQLAPGFKVSNPLRTWGGDNAEAVATAEKTIPAAVRHRDRLVSVQDFKDVTLRAPGVDVGRVEVLPLYDPVNRIDGVAGAVTVLVIPFTAGFDTPLPDALFLETVCRYLQPRRLITTELHVRGPLYKDLYVSVGIQPLGGRSLGVLAQAVKDRLYEFLSPLYGGRNQQGWLLRTRVLPRELEAIVAGVEGVQFVQGLNLGLATGGSQTEVTLDALELPRLVGVEVVAGLPLPLDQLRSAPAAAPTDHAWTPIPVVPNRC